ncbi:lysine 5,6-aminomutase reactivase subunit KamB [Rubeoparvulum massiliense]|uniref:lysine 5,6-aminomutase reactivase subunit KamB n=1 Tax=Rubeoparvulum massiliense TaxID=1631346 RepID=UPI00065DDADC|nr:hypothetical protein [Rubeoparvulum massiliense]
MFKEIWPASAPRVCIAGLAKNVGKTTVLNGLLAEGERRGYSMAVASLGVDGEKYDVWSYREKPAVRLPPHTLVATAEQALQESEVEYTILQRLARSTPLGSIYLIRTLNAGTCKLAGTPTTADLQEVWEHFQYQGATHLLIDGAYDRVTAAQPNLVDGLILSVGASVHPSLQEVVKAMEDRLLPLSLPDTSHLPLALRAYYEDEVAKYPEQIWLWTEQGGQHWPGIWSLAEGSILSEIPHVGEAGLYLPGALTTERLQQLSKINPTLHLVLRDHTRWFLEACDVQPFYRRGGHCYVQQQLPLLAVTMNADSCAGYFFDPQEMAAALRAVMPPDVPLVDVLRQQRY